MKYRVHRFNLKMDRDQSNLEQFLNLLEGEVIAVVPNVTYIPILLASKVDFLLIIERLPKGGLSDENKSSWTE